MNIYKVQRISKWGYDNYDSFVCFSRTEEEAKNLSPSFVEIDDPNFYKYLSDPKYHLSLFIDWEDPCWTWVKSKEDLQVIKLGTSESKQVGVILSSFHAG